MYLALCTTDPAEYGLEESECWSHGSYCRAAIEWVTAPDTGFAETAPTAFLQATAAWGHITHWAIVDSPVRGQGRIIVSGAFHVAHDVLTGDTVKVDSMLLTFSNGTIREEEMPEPEPMPALKSGEEYELPDLTYYF